MAVSSPPATLRAHQISWGNLLFMVVLLGLLIPSEVTIVRAVPDIFEVGMINTHWPLTYPIFGAPSVFATFVMRQFFIALPWNWERGGARRRAEPVQDLLEPSRCRWRSRRWPAVASSPSFHSWNLYLNPSCS